MDSSTERLMNKERKKLAYGNKDRGSETEKERENDKMRERVTEINQFMFGNRQNYKSHKWEINSQLTHH